MHYNDSLEETVQFYLIKKDGAQVQFQAKVLTIPKKMVYKKYHITNKEKTLIRTSTVQAHKNYSSPFAVTLLALIAVSDSMNTLLTRNASCV